MEIGSWVDTHVADRWHRYGAVRVTVAGAPVTVSVAVGVREANRVTAQACGSARGMLEVWFEDADDWRGIPATTTPEDVLDAIAACALRLAREAGIV